MCVFHIGSFHSLPKYLKYSTFVADEVGARLVLAGALPSFESCRSSFIQCYPIIIRLPCARIGCLCSAAVFRRGSRCESCRGKARRCRHGCCERAPPARKRQRWRRVRCTAGGAVCCRRICHVSLFSPDDLPEMLCSRGRRTMVAVVLWFQSQWREEASKQQRTHIAPPPARE